MKYYVNVDVRHSDCDQLNIKSDDAYICRKQVCEDWKENKPFLFDLILRDDLKFGECRLFYD